MELYQTAAAIESARRANARFTFTLHVNANVADALHLFSPEGERAWDPTWDPHFASASVFTTDGHLGRRVWVIDAYDTHSHVVRYSVFRENQTVTRIEIRVTQQERGSIAQVSYDRTALTPSADGEVEQFGTHGETMRAEWQQALDALHLQRSIAPSMPSNKP